MIKKILLMAGIASLSAAKGQTTRYIYETRVNPDTINLVDMKVEKTFLDTDGKHSVFISENYLKNDSVRRGSKNEQNLDKEQQKKNRKDKKTDQVAATGADIFFPFYITKEGGNKVRYHENLFGKDIFYTEDRKITWKILPETQELYGYKTQKAIANFGGRIWTAWFTEEIPVQDGPYKFYGLPGLIVKLQDEKGDYIFELIGKKKISSPYTVAADEAIETKRNELNSQKVSQAIIASRDPKKAAEVRQWVASQQQAVSSKAPKTKHPDQAEDPDMNPAPATPEKKEIMPGKILQNPIELKN